MKTRLNIAIVSSEVTPLAKTGGLADVSGSLPAALCELDQNAFVFMPQYKVLTDNEVPIHPVLKNLTVPILNYTRPFNVNKTIIGENVTVYLIENSELFGRDGLYGNEDGDYPDNAERYIFFNKAVLKTIRELNLKVDVIHANDWQTGLLPVYVKEFTDESHYLDKTATIFTIHNIAYQGLFWHFDMPLTGLPWRIFNIDGLEYYGKISFLKGGINFADHVTTVSKKYAKELQTEEFGAGLDGVLSNKSHKKELTGILNGVDYSVWNPETDKNIIDNFNVRKLTGKKECKKDLLKSLDLKYSKDIPVIGMITRLVEQKGLDILKPVMEEVLSGNLYFVLLASGDPRYEAFFTEIEEKYPDNFRFLKRYDYPLAHKIEAGSDIFLMPSRYEPCGLNQMYSLKYGTVPIVRATGGLDDTIEKVTVEDDKVKGTGFKFKKYESSKLLEKIDEALELYKKPKLWTKLVKNGMKEDFSWNHSAKEYLKLYKKVVKQKNKS